MPIPLQTRGRQVNPLRMLSLTCKVSLVTRDKKTLDAMEPMWARDFVRAGPKGGVSILIPPNLNDNSPIHKISWDMHGVMVWRSLRQIMKRSDMYCSQMLFLPTRQPTHHPPHYR